MEPLNLPANGKTGGQQSPWNSLLLGRTERRRKAGLWNCLLQGGSEKRMREGLWNTLPLGRMEGRTEEPVELPATGEIGLEEDNGAFGTVGSLQNCLPLG